MASVSAGAMACAGNPTGAQAPAVGAPPPPSRTLAEPLGAPASPVASSEAVHAADSSPGAMALSAKAFPLPGVSSHAFLDYLAYERDPSRVWVPVANTGSVDVFDTATSVFQRIDGFPTVEREVRGSKRIVGPSAASVGNGFVYIGNRATSEVCPVDVKTLRTGACLKLKTPTDGVAYVASTEEVWVTTPHDQSVTVLEAKAGSLKLGTAIKLDGETEGFSVDDGRGLFFTDLEDKDRTLVIDIKTRKVLATWSPRCGASGPRGLATDGAGAFIFVACTDHVQVLDGRSGALLAKLETGAGLDNIDYLATKRLLYAAAGKAARLTVAAVDDRGQFTVVASATTAEGARNAVVDTDGRAYVADPASARLLVFTLSR